jgi:tetratricopeptide (TPR) repeat protein
MRAIGVSWSSAALVAIAVTLVASTPAWTAPSDAPANDARRFYEEATAAFGLGRYDLAAEKYEMAFGVRPDPALLYNAAQSYRLAGNKARAMELYRNYVRLYPDRPNAADARNQVTALKRAIDDDRATNGQAVRAPAAPPGPPSPSAAPVAPLAVTQTPNAMPPPNAPSPDAAPQPPLLAADTAASTAPRSGADRDQPLLRRPWFWVAVAAVVAGGTVAVLLATRGEKFPDSTLGTASGN